MKTLIWKGTCTSMFTAALFIIAKIWKQPKCPLAEEWIKKMCYIYTMELYWAIRKNEILPFATTWMDLEGTMLSEMSDRERLILYNIAYMWNLKNITNWWIQQITRLVEKELVVTKGEREAGKGKIGAGD